MSPVKGKALANSGSSGKGSGHPLGPQPWRPITSSPVLSLGRRQPLTSPSRWATWSQSSCASQGLLGCPCLPALNTTKAISGHPTLRPPLFSQDAPSAHQLPLPPPRQTPVCPLPERLDYQPGCCQPVSLWAVPDFSFEILFLNSISSPGEAESLQGTDSVFGVDSVLPAALFQGSPPLPGPLSLDQGPLPAGLTTAISSSSHPASACRGMADRLWGSGCCVQTGWEAVAGLTDLVLMSKGRKRAARAGSHPDPPCLLFLPCLLGA